MTRARLSLAALTLGAATLALPPAAQAARDFSRGNVQAVDWNAMQIAIRTANGRTITYKVAPNASVKFTDCPECFPSPTYRDLAPPMYVHFEFEDLDVDEIVSFDVKEIGNAPRRVGAGSSGGTTSPSGGGSQTLKVKVLTLDDRRGTFQADVAGRRQTFRADRNVMRDLREGDLVVVTVERQGNDDVVTQVSGAGRSGRVTQIDKRRGEIGIEVNGRERFFRVENERMLERVKEGDRVTFDVETRNGREVITTLDR